MSFDDCKRAIYLLGEDDGGELVRQGEGAEGKQEAGAVTGGLRPAVRRADGEDKILDALVALAADPFRELDAGEGTAAAVEQYELGICPAPGFARLANGSSGGEEFFLRGEVYGLEATVACDAGAVVGE